jgi:hypothetical protein
VEKISKQFALEHRLQELWEISLLNQS